MSLRQWLGSILGACSRRRPAEKVETPFWEHPLANKEQQAEEEEKPPQKGYEHAVHLKDEGKEKFTAGNIDQAIERWTQALDVVHQDRYGEGGLAGASMAAAFGPGKNPADALAQLAAGKSLARPQKPEEPEMQELRITLMLNLALAHRKRRQWREAVGFCDGVLADEPENVKALYRKADALGELCELKDAEDILSKLEAVGEEGKKLAQQKREEWRKRRREADGRQKKMWSAALQEAKSGNGKSEVLQNGGNANGGAKWSQPKMQRTSLFDLRKKGIEWKEEEDFSDDVWQYSLGFRDAKFYQKHAMPLTFLAASALAEWDPPADLVVHCLLDGNVAPFGQPHDWGVLLERCLEVKTLTVVYIDVGKVNGKASGLPYGQLMRPTEEGRVGERVARATRFLGTYSEFRAHCQSLPGLVRPHIAFWADLPLYGSDEKEFGDRIDALKAVSDAGAMSIFTNVGEVQEPGTPAIALRLEESASCTAAILSIGLQAKMAVEWQWNRFIVPLDRGERGIIAAHAVLGVARPVANPRSTAELHTVLKEHGVELVPSAVHRQEPYQLPRRLRDTPAVQELRKRQWEAFNEKLRLEGRQLPPEASEEAKRQQMMEFYQFCGSSPPPTRPRQPPG